VRGGPLSHPDIVKALKPFVVASWSGRPGDEPADVKEAVKLAKPGGRNISCMVFDSTGAFVTGFWPMPESDPFGPDSQIKFVKKKLEETTATLAKPEATKSGLTLPTAKGDGVRIFLKFRAGRGPGNYKAPTVEAVTTTDAERKALAYPEAGREVKVEELKRWLEQLYPAAIMDSSGNPPVVSGTLTLAPAGSDGKKRFALLKGEVKFQMDDKAATAYRATIEAVVTYGEGAAFTSIRGAVDGVYPKSDPKHARAVEFRMTAMIESTPE
jgi:hypothetical protein